MPVAELASEIDFEGWRKAARAFRLAGVEPADARFRVAGSPETGSLFDAAHPGQSGDERKDREAQFNVPKAFVDVAQEVILHRSADRFDLLYRLLWRLRAEPDLMKVVSDRDVADALERLRNVSRASHKMKAFVRFRVVEEAGEETYVAWFEPAHRVLEKTAPFFMRRFTSMRWSILTPDGSCFWDGETMTWGPPGRSEDAPDEDDIEAFWKTYYASTFNPARLKVQTMQGEMPKRYWKNLPEAELIPELVAASHARTQIMVASAHTEPNARLAKAVAPTARTRGFDDGFVASNLEELKRAVQGCRRCDLWRDATHGVCGEGPVRGAKLMIVGEQPGDQEDLAGHPFIGPAGGVLDAALEEAGIDRSDVFVTNAVRHFKHEARGKHRLHKTPNAGEVTACRWWLDQERRLVAPKVTVALGATAGLSLFGRKPAVTEERGRVTATPDGATAVLTVHPAYLLRLREPDVREQERIAFVRDLKLARDLL